MDIQSNLINYAHIMLATSMVIGTATSRNQCSNLQTETTTKKCSENYIDTCNVFTMLQTLHDTHKGIQMKTQIQLRDLDKKVENILQKLDPCLSNPCVNGKCVKSGEDFTCTCKPGYFGKTCLNKVSATDCFDWRHRGNETTNDVYKVQLWKSKRHIEVYCDMITDGGGWTVLQRRYNGDVDFYRSFREYETGFGDIYEEFWLGLKNMEELASLGRTELRIDLTAADGSHWFESYSDVRLSPTTEYYLNISKGYQSSENSKFRMMLYNGYPFTTKDRDFDLEEQNDMKEIKDDDDDDFRGNDETNCGIMSRSGWWHGFCTANHFANLNGEYCKPGGLSEINKGYGGMWYKDFKGLECLKTSKIMLRRVQK